MRRTAVLGIALIVTPLLGLAQGGTSPAEASGRWFVGGAFEVGGVHFSLAFDGHRRHHRPYYYYRTHHHVSHRGYRCGSYCFKDGRDFYHHPSCPLVLHHFRSHRFHPAQIWRGVRVPPSFGYFGYWGHPGYDAHRGRSYYYHPDYYGRGHHDYYGRHGRYDRRGRGHGPYCRH